MNGIERITARIEADGKAEAERILSDAQREAERITARYEAEAASIRAELAERNERSAAERKERLIGAAQMEGRALQLEAKQAMVDRAYAAALEKLQSLSEKEYTALLASLLRRASVSGGGEVIVSPEGRQAARRAVEKANAAGGDLYLAEETRPIGRGFILREGRTEVNCAFDMLVRLHREQTAGAVAKLLFETREVRRGKGK